MSIYGNLINENFSINISAEYFNEMYFRNNSSAILTEASIVEITKNQMEKIKKIFIEFGLSFKVVFDNIKECSSNIVKILRTDGLNKNSIKKINSTFQKTLESIGKELKFQDIVIDNAELNNSDPGKVKAAIFLLINSLVLQAIIYIVLTVFFGNTSDILRDVLISPIFEEIAKAIAIKGNYIIEFDIVFDLWEAINYIPYALSLDISLFKTIKVRAVTTVMHNVTSAIQWIFSNTELLKNDEEDKDTVSFIGQVTGILIHIVWNLLSVKSKKFNDFLLK